MTDQTTLRATFVSESAGYRNTFGWYNSVTGLGGILFADVEAEGSHPAVVAGVSHADFTVNTVDVPNIQFFLISNGATLNRNDADDLTGAIKVIRLADGSWAVADVDSRGNVITNHGRPDILNGAGANALFTETSKNAGGVDYASSVVGTQQTAATLAGDTANGATGTIAWEDLAATRKSHGSYTKPGDADYNDAVFQISIVSANNPPVAHADAITIGEDAGATTINVLANDTTSNAGDTLRVTAVNSTGLLGTVAISADGHSVIYTPAASFESLGAGQAATETFTYTVANSSGATSSASTIVTINGSNDGPTVSAPLAFAAAEGASATTLNLLANAADVDNGDVLSVSGVTYSVDGGTASATAPAGVSLAGNNLSVDPTNAAFDHLAVGQHQTIVVSYSVQDGHGGSVAQTETITINGSNDGPTVSAPLAFAAAEGASATTLNLLSNAADVDNGDVLSVSGVTYSVDGGSASATAPAGVNLAGNNLTVDPTNAAFNHLAAGQHQTIVVGYSVQDDHGGSVAQTETITVNGTNDMPGAAVFTPASVTPLPEGSAMGTVVGTVVGTDVDGPTEILTYSLVDENGSPYSGPLAIDPNTGVVTVSGDIDFESTEGVLAATVRTTDQGGLHSDSAFTVAIGDLPEASLSAIEGYIANATIFVDDDNSGDLSAGDFVTHSDSVGAFHITGTHTGTIYLLGGNGAVDTATGLPFEGILRATPGSTVLSPLTTLIAAIAAGNGGDVGAATSQVVAALGLPAGVDPNVFDPIAAALSDNPADQATGGQLFAAGVQVYNTIVQAASLIVGTGADSQTAAGAVLGALVDQITNATGAVSLSDATTLESVITAAATAAGSDVSQTSAGAASIISGSNTLIDNAVANSSGTALDLLQAVAGNAAVAQGSAAQALVQAGLTNDASAAQSAFTGASLDAAVGTATANVDTNALAGAAGDNTLMGTSGADTLDGGGGNDSLYGGDGKDLLIGGTGNDLLDGGLSFDRASYTDATGGVTIDLAAGTAAGDGVGTDTLVDIEAAIGSDFADNFTAAGFTGLNGIPGSAAGSSAFEGRGGNDIIIGAINGQGQALTRINYLSATGPVIVDIAVGTADGGASVGHDTFSNVSTVWGSSSNDTLRGSDNAFATFETYEGRGGDDFIDGRGGYDMVTYNNDTTTTSGINVQLAAGIVTGDATVGTDTIRNVEAVRGTNFHDVYDATGYGLAGALNASTTNGNFNDFAGAGGDDTIIGNGNTRLNYSIAAASVTVDLETSAPGATAITVSGTASGTTEGTDTFSGVNAVQGSVFDDTMLGSSFNNTFTGLGGNDSIDGRGGFDTASYNSLGLATAGVSVNLATGTVTGDASIGTDTLRNVEGIQGTSFADTFVATGYGQGGALNVSTSNGSFNQFEGLAGDDSITGNGNTRLLYTNATAGVSVDMAGGNVTGDPSVGHDSFTGVNSVQASNFADTYVATGFAGFNGFQGMGGDDTITGNGATQVFFNNATAGVTVNLTTGNVNGDASVGHDTITGGVNNVIGSNFNDTIIGAGSNDFLNGGTGNDTINGMGGNDNLTGGTGADTFVYASGSGADFIADFLRGQGDRIDVSGIVGASSLLFIQSHATQQGANTLIDFGGGNSITLQNVTVASLVASDFVFAPNSAPTDISLSNAAVAENSTNGTVVGALSAVDPDAGDTATFTLTDDAGGRFAISGGNLVVAGALDYETATSHQVTVRVTDAFSNSYDEIFTIGVTDVAGVTLSGDANNNTLVGSIEPDTLSGLEGNDRLQGLAGNDLLDGGLGFDRAVYADATGGVTVNLVAGTASGGGVGTDTLVAIEAAVGSDFADTFNAVGFAGITGAPGGTIGFNEFEGRGGDDIIIGDINAQGQILTRVSYLNATAAVTVDIAAGTANGDASVGDDTFSNVSSVFGSAFNDTLRGSDNAFGTFESYEGRGGDDLIDGRGGYDIVTYNTDVATTSGINVQLAVGTVTGDGTVGTDTLRAVEAVRGTNFDDVYDATNFGNPGVLNVGSSGTFNDFGGAAGNDTVIGNGNTRLNYSSAAASVTVDLETSVIGTTTAITVSGTASGPTEGTDTFSGVNAVQGSVFDDTMLGSSFNNTFTGLGGNDSIDGRGGFDTASYNSLGLATAGVSVNLTTGTVTGDASVGTDTLRNVEGIQGTSFADTFVATGYGQGGALNVSTSNGSFNQFEGLAGDDSITGNGNTRVIYSNATATVTVDIAAGTADGDASVGHDTFAGVNSAMGSAFGDSLSGAASNDSFVGLAGNDLMDGRGGFDTAIYNINTTGGVNVNLASGTVTGDGSVGTDTLRNVEGVVGSNFDDTYDATGYGQGGALNVSSTQGNFNQFQGNAGNDTITGNNNTQILFTNATGGVTVNLSTGIVTGNASVGTDTITGGVFNVMGSNSGDTITGSSASDVLNGNGGNDNLTGGGGSDNFVFNASFGADTVTDFQIGADHLDFSASLYTSQQDVLDHATQSGTSVVITHAADTVTLLNTSLANLHATDFLLH